MVTHIIRKGHEKTRTMDRRCSFLFKPCQKAPSLVFLVLMTSVVLLLQAPQVTGLRCYVCGGSTGRECEEIVTRRWSPYVRPRPVLTSDGKRQWEECNDLINNKGCIKQVVDGVVLLRACWMQGAEKCMEDGHATVCTCNEDLCNRAGPASTLDFSKRTSSLFILLMSSLVTLFINS